MHDYPGNHHKAHPDRAIATLAARQRGVISLAQLRQAGLGRGAIDHRLQTGRLHRVHSGIYLVGHATPMPLALETAALLACGSGAVLSHRSAGTIWGFINRTQGPVDVTVAGRDCGVRKGVRLRRVVSLEQADVQCRDGLRVTAPSRTLLDLAGLLSDRDLDRAVNEALVLRLTTHEDLIQTVRRSKGRRGTRSLRAFLDRTTGPTFTRSEAERRLRRLLREADLAAPETNVRVGPYEVDMLWRAEQLVVEVDGYAFHSTRSAFERDRARDADLQVRGLRVLRFTWRQIVDQPEIVVARVTQLLKR